MQNLKPSPREAAIELLARRSARVSLAKWIDYRDAGYRPAKHHRLLIDHLEAVERGEIRRLMVCMPPGSAKSTYTSIEFPPWFMGRNAMLNIIASSHTQELAERFGRRVRNIVGSTEFRGVFGFNLSADSTSAGRWDNEKGGEYFAAGVGGSITGRRADLALIDDPVKSREDADSERSRDRAWDWYVNDLLTRLKPGARQIVVMTRWHEDDLGGRILARERDKWVVLELPMEAGPKDPLGRAEGELLWPDWFTQEMVETAKRDTRSWNALYQQNPVPDSGDYFKREWFQYYDQAPKHLQIYGASDYAITAKGGDYTVHGVFGVDRNDDIYLLDLWRQQATSDVWIDAFLDLVKRHKPIQWAEEQGQIIKSLDPFINKRSQERQTYVAREQFTSLTDKASRAQAIRGRVAQGKVKFPRNAPWLAELERELLTFPVGVNDDQVDMLSLFGRMLDVLSSKSPPQPKQQEDRWDRAFNREEESDDAWKTV